MVSTQITGTDTSTRIDKARLKTRTAQFNRIVRRAQAAIFLERLWPRSVPPLTTIGLFLSTSCFGLWHSLAPQPGDTPWRAIGTITFGAALLASPLLSKAKTLHVTRDDALDRLDDRLGDPTRPAHMLSDRLHPDAQPFQKIIWDTERLHILEQWLDKFEVPRPKPVMAKPIKYAFYAATALAVISAGIAGHHAGERLKEAFHWAVPPIPIKASAWIKPPINFNDESLVLDQNTKDEAHGGKKLSAHKGSMMTIVIYDADNGVSVNGALLTGKKTVAPTEGGKDKTTVQYELKLAEGINIISIGKTLQWTINVAPDNAPTATIYHIDADPKDPNTLDLHGTQSDDHGINEAEIIIAPAQNASPDATPLPSSAFPQIEIR